MTLQMKKQDTLAALFEYVSDPVIGINSRGRIQFANPAAEMALGVPAASLLGQPSNVHPVTRALAAYFEQAEDDSDPTGQEFTLASGVYEVRCWNVSRSLSVGLLKKVAGVQPRLADQIAEIIHGLKSPISSAKFSLDYVLEVGGLHERQMDFLLRAHRKLTYMTTLVNNLLDLLRLEAGDDLAWEELDLTDLVRHSVAQFEMDARQQGITFDLKMPATACLVEGDRARLERVIGDLISNAIKYSPNGGGVCVVVEMNAETAAVRVEDEGLGVAPEHLSHVFERFYRVHTPETHRIEGSGLGLALVKAAVEKHGGEVFADSQPGLGSVFGFRIPLQQASPEA